MLRLGIGSHFRLRKLESQLQPTERVLVFQSDCCSLCALFSPAVVPVCPEYAHPTHCQGS